MVIKMDQNKAILEEIANGLDMGIKSIVAIEDKIENEALKVVVDKQKSDYEKHSEKAKRLSATIEESDNVLQDVMLKSMIKMKTLLDDSDQHIAEMLMQGSNMLMIDLNHIKNEYAHHKSIVSLIEDILENEQTHIDALNPFL